MRRESGARWGAAALIVAVVGLRAAFVGGTRHDPLFRVPYLDGAFYHAWARSLAEGRGDFQGPYFLGPLYPHAVSLLYRLFGAEPFAVRVAQSACGVLDVGLVLGLGWRLFGLRSGLVAAALTALYGPLVFYEGLLVMETLCLTLVLAALFVLLVPAWRAARRGAAAGLLLGLASLGRPSILLVAPFAFAALRGSGRDPWLRRWWGAFACAAVWLVVLSPVLLRNARQGAGLVLTTNGGVNFYAGNAPGATGRFREPPGVRFFASPGFDQARPQASLPPAVAARALTVRAVAGGDEAADSAAWMRRARSWIGAHPADFLLLELRKIWLLLQAREVAQIESYAFHRQRLPALRPYVVTFTWIWPLAALGLWCAWRGRRGDAGVVAGFAAALLCTCVAFFVTSRYRLAAVPELAVLAGFGATTLLSWVARREARRVALALAVLVPLGVATRLGARPPRNAPGWENAQMAERLYALGDLEGAIRYQEEAARWVPERPDVQLNLALYWSERHGPGDLGRAERLLRELARRAPGQAIVHFNLGVVLEQQGDLEGARAAWRRALAIDPQFGPARSRLLPPGP